MRRSTGRQQVLAMKTKWRICILWSLFSLSIANSTADVYESPSGRRPFRRKKLFKLDAQKPTADTVDLPNTGGRKSALRLPTHNVTFASLQLDSQLGPIPAPATSFSSPAEIPRIVRPEAKTRSHFAYLPDVSVTCSTSDFVVRVKTAFYGLGTNAEELKLGSTCKSNGILSPYGDLLFTYPLTECEGQREMPPGDLVYKFVLHYASSPKRFPSGAHRIDVNIECRFPRYHHVYQLAVRPTWQTAIVRKRLKGRPNEFQIQLMDDSWTMPAKSQVYQLGQTVHFQVSASHLPSGGKLYISSCYATPSESPSKSSPKYTIIDKFGCMLESQRDPGASQFVSPRMDETLRFSLSAFQFTSAPDTQVHIHCKLFVTSEDPSPAHKSCTYRENKWSALIGDDSICECCETQCVTSKPRRAMMEGSATSGPLLVSDQPSGTEDDILPVIPSLVSMREDVDLEEKMNQQIDKLHSTENLWDTTDLSKHDGEEDQQSYKELEEEEEEEEEEEKQLEISRVTLEVSIESGLDKLGLRAGQIMEEGGKSGVRDLGEFGEDGSGFIITEEFLEGKEDGAGSKIESERQGSELREVDMREDEVSGERQWSHLEKKEGESPLIVGVKEMSVSEREGSSQWSKNLGRDKEQSLETESKDEERERYTGRHEEVEPTIMSEIDWTNDGVPSDGLVEKGIVDDKEMTWYFTWR